MRIFRFFYTHPLLDIVQSIDKLSEGESDLDDAMTFTSIGYR